ncbi:MAG: biotin--[acetyl-CoA-carboxylase] ligase, partial [Clostridiales bacterium]|nr:biotin--[acetyl-CoA-carboxylase] ligase [Clostridiales bacterium]
TSLYLETGKHFSRAKLVSLVMKYFIDYYEEFIEKESLASVMDEYNKNLINRDEEVRILRSRGEWKGVSLGIDESGALLVKDEEGNVRSVVAGEVSVRGLYQYT